MVLPDRTAEWQSAVDPDSQCALGACEHIVHERSSNNVRIPQAILVRPNMSVDLLIHDVCHFEDSALNLFA